MSQDLRNLFTPVKNMHRQLLKIISSISGEHYIFVRKESTDNLLTTYLAKGRQPAECDDVAKQDSHSEYKSLRKTSLTL